MTIEQGSPVEFAALDKLSQWAHGATKNVVLGHVFSASPPPQERSLIKTLKGLFQRSSKKREEFAELATALTSIHQAIARLPEGEEKRQKIAVLSEVYDKIKREFDRSQADTSVAGLIRSSDLLEAYNTAFHPGSVVQGVPLHRIRTTIPNPQQAEKTERATKDAKKAVAEVGERAILLADYHKIEAITAKIAQAQAQGSPLSKKDIEQLVASADLHVEPAPMGKMIDILYRHRFAGQKELGAIVTQVAQWRYGSKTKTRDVEKTVAFFKNLHIDLWMEIGGELYSFSELFGYDLREQTTYHASFTRSLTESSKDLILEQSGYRQMQADVRHTIGEKAQVVCSNSYSRNSLLEFKAGEADTARTIRGKVIDIELEEEGTEHPAEAHVERHPFTLRGLLGGYCVQKFSATPTDAECQGQLLGFMASMIDHHSVTAVVQRLAPADVHHYYATADGTVLNRQECCEVLQQEISERERLGAALTEEDRAQIEQLKELQAHFAAQGAEGNASTINIAGSTLSSVSTKALRTDPGILASNDRKIMMVRHDDGTIAIHAFIGASAVNNVGVTATPGATKAGHDYGWMAMGQESKEEFITERTGRPAAQPKPPEKTITSMIRQALRAIINALSLTKKPSSAAQKTEIEGKKGRKASESGREITVVHEEGVPSVDRVGFAMGGSTVVSLYLSRDFHPIPPVRRFLDVGTREMKGKLPESIEIQCHLGDPLATPVLYQTAQLMASLEITSGTPLERLRLLHQKLKDPSFSPTTPLTRQWLDILDTALMPPSPDINAALGKVSGDKRYMLQQLVDYLSK
jgi:phosphatidylserine decarboxylase